MIPKTITKFRLFGCHNSSIRKGIFSSVGKFILSYTIKNIFFYLIPLLLLTSCAKKEVKHEIPPRPVKTAIVIQKDVPVYIDSFGNLTSINNVDIKSQVTGQIASVNFTEGQIVKKEDPLFTIDKRPFEATLEKQEAQVAQDMADLKMKQDTLERNRKLVEQNLVSKQDFEKYETDVTAAEAKLSLDKAQVKLGKIDLEYCSIVSPIDGLTGRRQVDPGNIVSANTGPTLVNIKSIDPLYIDFTIIERDLNKARASMKESKLAVEIIVDSKEYTGELQFLDNAVDEQTGTVSLRAVIPNKNAELWPGQFVKVRLILGTEKDALLVPYETVQIGLKGCYLFAVTADNKAELRMVTSGSKQGDDIVVEQGVKVGEKVVTVGQMGLSPGVSVVESDVK